MHLTNVYERPDRALILYDLLKERDETVNISHKEMPAWSDHVRFIESRPYQNWYFIDDNGIVGACYITKLNEIGVQIFKKSRGKGYGAWAVETMIGGFGKRRYLANINPHNEASAALFAKLGFKLAQHTYERI